MEEARNINKEVENTKRLFTFFTQSFPGDTQPIWLRILAIVLSILASLATLKIIGAI